jgi:hypothetical protein
MTDKEIDELDMRRGEMLFHFFYPRHVWRHQTRQVKDEHINAARAIRLSDEAAGYELCKRVEHRGAIG